MDQKQNGELVIAAASDLNFAMPEIIKGFKDKNKGPDIKAIYGSSGNIAAQIANGAPFDIFFSASLNFIEQMEKDGLIIPDSKFMYAIGRIVIWVPIGSKIDISKLGIKSLLDPSIKNIAIANPQHAPYGKAAVEAMSRLGVYEAVKDKLIFGENISQTAQFIQSGAADIGIIALSVALSPRMKSAGTYWLIPEETYNRIEQWAVIIKRSGKVRWAEEFMNYFRGEDGRKILAGYCFILDSNKGAK